MRDFLENATLDDFMATELESATAYQHNEYACGCIIFDDFPGRNDPVALLAEIKASISRSLSPGVMSVEQVEERLGVNRSRVYALLKSGEIEREWSGAFSRESVEAYKLKRGDKKGGRYPSE